MTENRPSSEMAEKKPQTQIIKSKVVTTVSGTKVTDQKMIRKIEEQENKWKSINILTKSGNYTFKTLKNFKDENGHHAENKTFTSPYTKMTEKLIHDGLIQEVKA